MRRISNRPSDAERWRPSKENWEPLIELLRSRRFTQTGWPILWRHPASHYWVRDGDAEMWLATAKLVTAMCLELPLRSIFPQAFSRRKLLTGFRGGVECPSPFKK